MERDLTSGSVLKNIIIFSLPYLLSYFLQTLYGMADLFIIGQFEGAAGTTAVSVGSQVMHMVTVIIVGLAMGTTVSIGQAVGKKDKREAAQGIGNSTVLFLVFAVILMVVLLLLVDVIVSIMSTPEEACAGTTMYLKICFVGIPFITAYNVISSLFRGLGDTKSPMYFVAIACAANIALDYLFIGAFGLGAAGAALGTTLAQTISVAVSLSVILRQKTGISVTKQDFKPKRFMMGKIIRIGAPIAFQDGVVQIAFLAITVIANQRGLNDAAAVGIVEKIITFLFLVPSTMLAVVSAMGAQNIGADKPERAIATLKYAVFIAAGFGLIVAVFMQFAADSVVALFTDASTAEGAEVVRLGGQYLRGYVFDCVFAGMHFSFSGYFCAIGKSWISFLHNVIAIGLVRVPLVYIVSNMFTESLFPMGCATVAGSFTSAMICIIAFLILTRGQRKKAGAAM